MFPDILPADILPDRFLVRDLEAQSAIQVPRYDYSGLEQEKAEEIKTHTFAIRACMHRTVKELIEIGEHLTRVKELLPHGAFGKWLDEEFSMCQQTARRFMNVYERFGQIQQFVEFENPLHSLAKPSVIYELAAPSFPQEVLASLIAGEAVVVGGESKTIDQLTVADVKDLKPQKIVESTANSELTYLHSYEFYYVLDLQNPIEFIQQIISIIERLEELQRSLRLNSYETREIERLEAALQGGLKRAVNKFQKTLKTCISSVKFLRYGYLRG